MTDIRRATSRDVEAVLAFWKDAATVGSSTDDGVGIEQLLSHESATLLIAVDDDEIAGSVIAAFDGWRGSLYRLAVREDRRRRGIGRRLVEHGEETLRVQGARRLHLIVQHDEDAANEFWTALGYDATDQLRYVKTVG